LSLSKKCAPEEVWVLPFLSQRISDEGKDVSASFLSEEAKKGVVTHRWALLSCSESVVYASSVISKLTRDGCMVGPPRLVALLLQNGYTITHMGVCLPALEVSILSSPKQHRVFGYSKKTQGAYNGCAWLLPLSKVF
jgi:hypothetical protein